MLVVIMADRATKLKSPCKSAGKLVKLFSILYFFVNYLRFVFLCENKVRFAIHFVQVFGIWESDFVRNFVNFSV